MHHGVHVSIMGTGNERQIPIRMPIAKDEMVKQTQVFVQKREDMARGCRVGSERGIPAWQNFLIAELELRITDCAYPPPGCH